MSASMPALPRLALGTISVVLGSIALMLFFLPILSIPIAICGLIVGCGRIVRSAAYHAHSLPHRRSELRWAIIGCLLCSTVMVLGFTIAYAPIGEASGRATPSPFWSQPDRPYVPPPARPQ
ncbi:MAG TPA: hypothetical protein VGI75_14830 [Pirellulales bacterium]